MVIRAIKTEYRGVLFMSTLEADFAKTMDTTLRRIRWSYEPEGIKLPDGQNYRCDFLLPHLRTWVEVKGPHDQRIDKPAVMADALIHAPGCGQGELQQPSFVRPDGAAPATCKCGYGQDFPWFNVIVVRPAVAGKLIFEAPHAKSVSDALLVALDCPICHQFSFIDHHGAPICRRCLRSVRGLGGKAFKSGQLRFAKVEPPRGNRRTPRREPAA